MNLVLLQTTSDADPGTNLLLAFSSENLTKLNDENFHNLLID